MSERSIVSGGAMLQADQDMAFLASYEARGVRLQLDYLKAELVLERHGVKRTIVVFGSTRIPEPARAAQAVSALRAAVSARPDDALLAQRLAVAERVAENSRYYEIARELGRIVGEVTKRDGATVTIMTGGGPGLMEAANRGAFDADAESIGLNIALPEEQRPNPYITPELSFRFHYFAIRKLHFMLRAAALVAFPGGFGTFDELFETLALIQTHKIAPVPVVLVGEAFWRRAVDIDFLVAEGVIAPEDRELFSYAETAEEIWEAIRAWHAERGMPIDG